MSDDACTRERTGGAWARLLPRGWKPAGLPRLARLAAGMALCGAMAARAAPQNASDAATTSTMPAATPLPVSPVSLQPVLKPPLERVSLRPILKGEEPTTATGTMPRVAPTPSPRPRTATTAAMTMATTPATTTLAARSAQPRATPRVDGEGGASSESRAPTPAMIENLFKAAIEAPPTAEARVQLRDLVLAHAAAPAASRALFRIGEISETMGDAQEAMLAYMAAAVKLEDADVARQARLKGAEIAQDTGMFSQAAAQWQELRRIHPELESSPEVLYRHATALSALGQWAGADAAWERLLALPAAPRTPLAGERPAPPMSQMLLSRALGLELQGRRAQAREFYDRVVQEFKDTPESVRARARLADMDRWPQP